jgi:integrase/recombinase XerD
MWHYRDHAIMYLMLTSGLRVYDIVKALRENYQTINGIKQLILPGSGKNVEDECVKLSSGAIAALDEYLHKRRDRNPYLFISHKLVSYDGALSRTFFRGMFARVLKECGLDHLGITPHCLRHTAGILNLQRGGSLEQTRHLLRHVSIQSTLVYQDYLNRIEDQSEALIEAFILES